MQSEPELPLLEVVDLAVHLPVQTGPFGGRGAVARAVDGISFRVGRGEVLGLVGESGCGKTTTGRAVLRLLEATRGRILLEGRDLVPLSERELVPVRRRAQMIFQDPFGSLDPRMTVAATLQEPLDVHGVGPAAGRPAVVARWLERVGLAPEHGRRFPHEFSGGQRQRIAIARALILEPALVVADEPVAALDVSIRAQIVNLLQDLQRELGLSMLFIAHDLAIVRHLTARTAVMYLGRLVETGPSDALVETPRHPYTVALISSVPVADPRATLHRVILPGETPPPTAIPPGCPLHPRCPAAVDRCRVERPELAPVAPGSPHLVACHRADEAAGLLRSWYHARRP